jgi:mannose-6-phosphate isomerase
MNKPKLYPLQFNPILKQKVWGGTKLQSLLHKKSNGNTGESWEISAVENSISIVSKGALKGQEITRLIKNYTTDLVGERVYNKYGDQFPLLFKFIDAHQDLSVQVHPNDRLAKERHNSFGKTEMWYVLQAEKNARLILGFNKELNKSKYVETLNKNQLTSILGSEVVEQGETYLIEPGTVHAIGAGVLLAEIQQTSDITYRIYDWDRPDTDGKLRQLHTQQALDAIQFTPASAKIQYQDRVNERVLLVNNAYFTTHKLVLTKDFGVNNFENESFKVYMCTDGKAEIVTEKTSVSIYKGATILIPACSKSYQIKTENATFLEVYIPE